MRHFYLLSLKKAAALACLFWACQTTAKPWVVHEWGTFTSLQDSSGKQQLGLYQEEEALPNFVNGRCRLSQSYSDAHGMRQKCTDFTPLSDTSLGVNQKMETPVLYFYSDQTRDVAVTVEFPQGIISQWYPDPFVFSPQLRIVHPAPLSSSVTWKLKVLSEPKALPQPETQFSQIWLPSREVAANVIQSKDQNEKFIFYRGLGRFSVGIKITSSIEGNFAIENTSSQELPAIFVLKATGDGKGTLLSLGSLGPQSKLKFQEQMLTKDKLLNLKEDLKTFHQALKQAGLYEDEAIAMLKTWEQSYFQKAGLRVLYVLPRAWTDKLLPINIDPQPDQLERVMVGRIEIMSAKEEELLLAEFNTRAEIPDAAILSEATLSSLGILQEPKLRRLYELLPATGKTRLKDYLHNHFGPGIN